jgi:predicted AAA+ superfamily ATPase
MFQRFCKSSKTSSFFLFGARGTGKSTWVRSLFKEESPLIVDLLLPRVEQQLALRPDDLIGMVKSAKSKWVIIDEVQKVPKILDVVHHLIEQEKIKFILTGSSARKLKLGGSNLLAGRAFFREMFPLTFIEIGADVFDLNEALHFGTLPKIYAYDNPDDKQEFLESYAHLFLREEIAAEQLVRKIDPFRKFLEVAAQANAKIVNHSNIAKSCGVDVKTVQNYFHILEDTHLGFVLEPWIPSVRERVMRHPKFYFFDLGVCRALARQLDTRLNPRTSLYGELFEQWIVMEVYRWARYSSRNIQLFYYQPHGGKEIDLLISRPGEHPLLVEIKSTDLVEEKHVEALLSSGSHFENATKQCVSNDPLAKMMSGVECIHWREFIEGLYGSVEKKSQL